MPVALRIAAAAALVVSATGCASMGCGADQAKVAQLKPGMSRDETSTLMGCPGKLVSDSGTAPGKFTTVEWSGPDSLLFSRTYVVFLDDRIYTFSTEKRGGF